MTALAIDIKQMGATVKSASRKLAASDHATRNSALEAIASGLLANEQRILTAAEKDVTAARESGLGEHVVDRMVLNHDRVVAMADACKEIAALPDPIGEVLEERTMPNGLQIQRISVPLGVIGVIFESRPNVTIDITALCLKSGNGVILRGGKEALGTNIVLAEIARNAIKSVGLPADAIQFVSSTDRSLVGEMLRLDRYIDLIIPRGSAELVHFVGKTATMPAITGGVGVCHTYVDAAADLDKAVKIVVNAKVKRPTVCNALDTVLVHSSVADKFLPALALEFGVSGVEMHADSRAMSALGDISEGIKIVPARADDFGTEFLALIAAVKVVDSVDEAMDHIAEFGSGHSEAIITEDKDTSERFLAEVDAAAVFANTSTYFNDGGQFGLGAEVAISTSKLHARGPMGLREITTYKWVVRGDGQVRE